MKREQTGQMWRGLSATVLAIVLQVGQWSASGCGLLRRAVSESLCGARLERVERCEESNRGPGGGGGAEDMKWLRVPERLGTNDLPMFLLTCFFLSFRAGRLSVPARTCCQGVRPHPCCRLRPRRGWLTKRRGCPDGITLQEEGPGVGIRPA